MYVEHIVIKSFRVLENLRLEFQAPKEKENSINVMAGVNGSGKTSVLDVIKERLTKKIDNGTTVRVNTNFSDPFIVHAMGNIEPTFHLEEDVSEPNVKPTIAWLNVLVRQLTKRNKYKKGVHSSPRLIYLPAKLAFQYQQVASLNTAYQFYNEVNTDLLLGNAEQYIRDFVISKERLSNKSDPKERTKEAVGDFNRYFECVDLSTKLDGLDIHQQNRPIFKNTRGDLVTIDQLSDGEKQLYGRVVSLMILNPTNSIILIDEPEISLHPSWQLEIMKIYAQIGEGNQFIVATHSPQIIANTPYSHLILFKKNKNTGKVEVVTPASPPAGLDVNSILNEIMGASSMPEEQHVLHEQYRKFVEKEDEGTEEAKAVLAKILLRESDKSEFLQEMRFMIELRG